MQQTQFNLLADVKTAVQGRHNLQTAKGNLPAGGPLFSKAHTEHDAFRYKTIRKLRRSLAARVN